MKVTKILGKTIGYFFDNDYRFLFNDKYGLYNNLADEEYLKRKFKAVMGKELNLNNPRTFNEKLQWLKLYNRNPRYMLMVDKYKVRDYIAEKLGKQYLIPLIGVWDDPDDIDFNNLPNQFVLKCNHNSGLGMCICKDKSKLDINKVKIGLRKGLKQDYYLTGREWPYKNVQRKIIAEKFMTNGTNELEDYKVHNFNGVPKIILVCKDRFMQSGLTEDFYSEKWEHLDIKRPGHPNAKEQQEIPVALEEMLKLSKILSKDIPFVRTDFYLINGKVYFGEITFFPASGMERFVPQSIDEKWGEWLKIDEEE